MLRLRAVWVRGCVRVVSCCLSVLPLSIKAVANKKQMREERGTELERGESNGEADGFTVAALLCSGSREVV